MKSWKTTVSSIVAAVGGSILGAYQLKPELLTGFPTWLPGVALLASVIGGACVGVFARDNDKTSEQVGAGAAPKSPVGTLTMNTLLALGLLALFFSTGCTTAIQESKRDDPTVTVTTYDTNGCRLSTTVTQGGQENVKTSVRVAVQAKIEAEKVRAAITKTGMNAGAGSVSGESDAGTVLDAVMGKMLAGYLRDASVAQPVTKIIYVTNTLIYVTNAPAK